MTKNNIDINEGRRKVRDHSEAVLIYINYSGPGTIKGHCEKPNLKRSRCIISDKCIT